MEFLKTTPKAVFWSPHMHLQEQKNLHTWPSKSCGVGPGQAL